MDVTDEIPVICPYCGETFTICVETTIPSAKLIEDCAICCRPIEISVHCAQGNVVALNAIPL